MNTISTPPDKKQPEALRLAEMLTADEWPGHVTLVSYAQECVTELLRQHAENETLRAGYAAARLEIESLKAQLHAAKQINAAQFGLLAASIPGAALRPPHGQAPASKIEGLTTAQESLGVEFEKVLHDNLFDLYEESAPHGQAPAVKREFTNELGNSIRITVEGPNSMHENIVTPMEAKQLREALNEHAQKSAPAGATLVHLDHIACIDGGELRYITGRKAPAYDCELYAMPNGGSAPQLYAAPTTQPTTWTEGVQAVAAMLAKKADDFAMEHGHDDMGGLSFGSGAHAEAKMDWHSGLLELEEEVRAMLDRAYRDDPRAAIDAARAAQEDK